MVIFALPYDLAELYEFKNNGAQAASTIQSIPLMAQKIGSALGALVWGIALDSFGFDGTAAVQTAAATDGMVKSFCGWINFILLIYVGLLLIYKMNRKRVELLQEANKARKEGRKYSTEGFEDIL